MNAAANHGELDEPSLVKLYMDLTGTSESCARSVYMFVSSEEGEKEQQANGLDRWRIENTESQTVTAKSSPARAGREREFGIGFFISQILPAGGE
jgi:hypothetical protein